ncbi:cytochrome P450, partial [Endogone sp. FLAS-F59071]
NIHLGLVRTVFLLSINVYKYSVNLPVSPSYSYSSNMSSINPADHPILTATAILLATALIVQAAKPNTKPKLIVQPHNRTPFISFRDLLGSPKEDPWKRLITLARDSRNFPLCVMPGIVDMKPMVVINSVEMIKEVLVQGQAVTNGEQKYARAKEIRQASYAIFGGHNIGNTLGHEWKWRRQAFAPAFQPRQIIAALLPYTIDRVNSLNEDLAKSAVAGTAVDLDEKMMDITIDVICQYIFGFAGEGGDKGLDFQDIGGKSQLRRNFADLFGAFNSIWWRLPLIKYTEWSQRPHKPARERLEALLNRAIEKSLSHPDLFLDADSENPRCRPFIFQLAANSGFEPNTDHSLAKELVVILFAGHDTTSHTASFTFGLLAQNPDIQQKVFKEVRDLLGPGSINPDVLTSEVLSKMPYVTAVIKESMRMYPVVNFLMVENLKDVTLGGLAVPAGTLILSNVRGAQMDPNVFPNPEKFDPERWLDRDAEIETFQDVDQLRTRSSHPEFVFSLGPHACIGRNLAQLELRTLIAAVVNKFELKMKEGETIDTRNVITMYPKNGIHVMLKERD